MKVVTRFAPSPTGYLHVGGVRTALFSWLFARHNNGKFILRIEDTDRERSTQESVNAILEGMEWIGLNYDEGPYYQTKRFNRYLEVADLLLKKGLAYKCYCSKERLTNLREEQLQNKQKPRYDGFCRDREPEDPNAPFVLRFKNPETGFVEFKDEVYGEIKVSNQELDDLIIVRSDNTPTYNFTVVIDDMDMGITHVIRGDDHINNTPRQINMFNALGAQVPIFAHLPMILGSDGKRLSKRHGAVSVLEFKELGILPEALLNYLARLGWAYKDQEIFSIEELIKFFDLKNVSRAAASFNHEKLLWLNQHYQKFLDPKKVAQALKYHFEKQGINTDSGPALEDLVQIQAERCKTLKEICEKSTYFFEDNIQYDEKAVEKHINADSEELLAELYKEFKNLEKWDHNNLQTCINNITAKFNVGMGKVAQPLRVVVTGGTQSPSIDKTLELIGKDKVLLRISSFLEK